MSRGNSVPCMSPDSSIVLVNLATIDACLLQHNKYNVYARSLENCWEKFEGLARQIRLDSLVWLVRYGKLTVQAIIHHYFYTYGRQVQTVAVQVYTTARVANRPIIDTIYTLQTNRFSYYCMYCQGMMHGTVKGRTQPVLYSFLCSQDARTYLFSQ